MSRDELRALLVVGERLFTEISVEFNGYSVEYLRRDLLDYRRQVDMNETFLALALFAMKKKLIPEKPGECPVCGALRQRSL
jgi:hypothetical protein